ncbi:MAG: alpha/beta fold hydrolase [Candidatus Staskawiczbacteria bacterium]|nr:alpha/beta fold hydrolase [Candidatus Staskawiczbacteria bacterium]
MNDKKPIFIEKNPDVGVLLLHGFTSAPGQFKELAEYLSSRDFTVYAPFVAGHGTCPEDLEKTCPDDWKESVKKAYFDLKQKVKNIVIIGNSFGSNLGFWLANEVDNEPLGIISLGAPIFLRWQRVIKFRLRTYGKFRRFYTKPSRIYKTDYTDMKDEISYSVIPTKSFKEFLSFIENETMPNLSKVKMPVLIANANKDTVIHKKSADYIFSHIGSTIKEVFWFNSNQHGVAGSGCEGLFPKIYSFIKEIT